MPFNLLAYSGPGPALLTDEVIVRLQLMSCCLLLVVLGAVGLRGVWKALREWLISSSELSFVRALAISVLLGVFVSGMCVAVQRGLKVIAPEVFRQPDPFVQHYDPPDLRVERYKSLHRLSRALLLYASQHEGKYPAEKSDLKGDVWHCADPSGLEYQYVSGCSLKDGEKVLVYEPDIFNGMQLQLLANGDVRETESAGVAVSAMSGKK